jgi:hypothetical protein
MNTIGARWRISLSGGNAGYFADNLLRKDLVFQRDLDELRERG